MKSLRRQTVAVAVALLALAVPSIAQVTNYKDIKAPALRKLNMPQPVRVQLDNGMVIFLMEDHELPLIRGTARIRGGERDVPASKAGMAQVLGQAWRTGGTETKTGDELDDFLESRAARVETSGTSDSTFVRLNLLKDDFDAVFPIFLDVLKNPAFRQEKIDLAKTQLNSSISRRNDEPQGIIGRELRRLGYGATSPYASQPEYGTVGSITRDDLLAFHKRFVHPNNIIFGLVGDFDARAMEAKLRMAFGSWPRGPQAAPAPDPATAIKPAKPGVYLIAKSDVTQANIGLVHAGVQRNNPDYYALAVMNEILGGGFSGRLMNHLRSERGLTYGVGGGVGSEWDYPGLMRVQMSTKSATTIESVEALKNELSDLRSKPFTAEEMKLAKDSILNAFVFTMDSREKVLNQAMLLEFYGFPPDYFQKYSANIEKVTAEDVARVAQKYVNPSQVAILVVGNEKDFEKPLSTVGTVTPVDITIPEPGAADKNAAPATSNSEGLALLKKVQDFVGGKTALAAVKAVRSVSAASRKTPQGSMDVEVDNLIVYPDRLRSVVKMSMGEMTIVITPEAAFMSMPGMTREVPASQRQAALAEVKQDLLTIAKNADQYTFAVSGSEKVGNVDAKVLDVASGDTTLKLVVDPSTGRVLRKITRSRGPMGQADQVFDYTEWKKFGGINFVTASTITVNGEPAGSMTVKSVEVNPTVDPALFVKPAAQ